MSDTTEQPVIEIVYRGEMGENWVPTSQRDLWNYAVRTKQVIVPPLDAGPPCAPGHTINTDDKITIVWIPPEYAGRLVPAAPPPQPVYFELTKENTDV